MLTKKISKKKTIILISIITILIILLILILTNTIKLNDNYSNPSENQIDKYQDEDNQYTNWMNYLLKSNIEEITLEKYSVIGEDTKEDLYKKTTLTPMNLKDIFNTLNDYNLTKVYSMGRGGITNYQLTISYIKDNKNYQFEIINNFIQIDNIDNELLNVLNDNNYNIINEELKDIAGSFYYFEFDNNYNTSIYDSYF